jgi:DNA gyrase subunit A
VTGQGMREEDVVLMLIPAHTRDTVLFFSDRGKVYSEKAYQIPDASRADKGIPIVNVLSLDGGERITAAVAVPNFDSAAFCTMVTQKGRVKRMALSEFASVRPSGLIAISLDEGDLLGWARLTSGNDDIILVTQQGQALRFSEKEIRTMGRQAGGVTGIKFKPGDRMASMDVIEPGGSLLVITELGFGKRVLLDEYPSKGRGTRGVTTLDQKSMAKTGKVAAARVVQEEDEVTFISAGGRILRINVKKDIHSKGRSTRGMHLMDLVGDDVVASLARMAAVDLHFGADEPADG